MENKKIKRYILGTFYSDFDDTLVISDPCYKNHDKLNLKISNFKPGKYYIFLDTVQSPLNEDVWLNSFVGFAHESEVVGYEKECLDADKDFSSWNTLGKIVNDSGSLGIFIKEGFEDTHFKDSINKEWYASLKYNDVYFLGNRFSNEKIEITTTEKLSLIYDSYSLGVIFSTHGDSTYKVLGKTSNNEITKFIVVIDTELKNFEIEDFLINAKISLKKYNKE